MNITSSQKRIIHRVLNVFETGTPNGNYGAIAIFNDGPNNIRQITYGRSQTTEYGNLRELVFDYVNAGGTFSEALRPFAEQVGSIALTDNDTFKNLLRKAGRTDLVMRETQDIFFDKRYYNPAIKWAKDNGFTFPLSALVIYDSFIHSGRVLWLIRQMFPENPPNLGGDEKAWIRAYVNARRSWLENHHRPIVRRTIYRMDCFREQIANSNWDLSQLPIIANGTPVS